MSNRAFLAGAATLMMMNIFIAYAHFFARNGSAVKSAATYFFTLTIAEQVSIFSFIFSISYYIPLIAMGIFVPTANVPAEIIKKEGAKIPDVSRGETDREKFLLLFPYIRSVLINHIYYTHKMPPAALTWVHSVIDYNIKGGVSRGMSLIAVFHSFEMHSKGRKMTDKEIARASVLGWAIEYLQTFLILSDDVVNSAVLRRGDKCWHEREEVGKIAVNDAFLLESFVFTIIKLHFQSEPYYGRLVDLFLNVIQKTTTGKLVHYMTHARNRKKDIGKFNLDRYSNIVKYKTAIYSFYLPVAVGMIVFGVEDKNSFTDAQEISCIMGEYFNIQNDYMKLYENPDGKGE